jgi:type III secretion system YscQ/HrcQ family protein
MARTVAAYPWGTLERLSRRAVRATLPARRLVARAVAIERLAPALSELLGVEVWVVLREVTSDVMPRSVDVTLELPGGAHLALHPEPELARQLVARVLGRDAPLTTVSAELDAPLRGALAAIAIEAARRTQAAEPLRLAEHEAPGTPAVRVDATVVVAGKPYSARAWVTLPASLAREPEPGLAQLAHVPVAIPLVIAVATADPAEISRLAPGDAFLPGASDWVDRRGIGRAALAAACAERGVAVHLADDGSIVLGDQLISFSADESMTSTKNDVAAQVTEAVLDAPVVVRVEVGSVSLTGREWAALQPGDVIETGRRINEPVVLRIAGREVARGELVEIEGELGVRIREILSGESA